MNDLTKHVCSGRSLIFVQTALDHYKVMRTLSDRKVNVQGFSTMELGPSRAFVQYLGYLMPDAALVAVVPALTTGVRIRADRIIWVEGRSYSKDSPEHDQAMGRVAPGPVPRIYIKEFEL